MAYCTVITAFTMLYTERHFFRPAQSRDGWSPVHPIITTDTNPIHNDNYSSSGPGVLVQGLVDSDFATPSATTTTSSTSSSTNSSPVVALELNFDVNALGGANESHWPADALQACEFSSADILNLPFSDFSGNLDAFDQESSFLLNDLSAPSINQFTSSDFLFPSLSAPASAPPVTITTDIPMNHISFAQTQIALDNSVRSSASSSVSPPPCDSPPTGASGIIIRNASPVAAIKSSRKRGRTSANLDDEDNEDEAAVVRRQKNTLAARKYRQKRLDRIKELEDALAEVTGDRDDLRIRLARQEAETKALKALMAQLAPAASAITTARSVTAKED
ncbi:bZIP transcription factor [Ceratocystis lukuohia]|uniref:BZIP transcription factor n=1 Tax=Ceratocystis lukuohia TaxID=2019550 RepID=A0ABR4MUK7_9PEZI